MSSMDMSCYHGSMIAEGTDMKKPHDVIPRQMRLPLILTITCNMVAYYGTRLFTAKRYHYDLSNGLDDRIPLIPWTIAIYLGCYAFWIANYLLGCRQERRIAFRFLGADLVAKMICMACFLLFPTTNVRPFVEGSSFWEMAMVWLYSADAADNLFPSIHCLTSWFCVIAVRENEDIPRWYWTLSVILALSVCISTLTTKQHVLMDVAAGIALAEGSYALVEKSGFALRYQEWVAAWYDKRMTRRVR